MWQTTDDTSGQSFIRFWEYVSDRGLMKVNTARSLAASAKQVLNVEKNWEGVDIRDLDVEGLIERFKNLRARDYKPETLNVYSRRFRRALVLYLDYLKDPTGWRPITQRVAGKEMKKDAKVGKTRSRPALGQLPVDQGAKMITYPFPLRDDCIVQVTLPMELHQEDVGRLTTFLNALVMRVEGVEES
jgi:hypothetical protein